MDRRSLGLSPPSPRPTMRALLITACLFAAVPSAEAVSLPSISSSAGIAMAVVSVALALSLLIGMAFNDKVKRLASKVGTALGLKNQTKQENVETGQPTEIAGTGTPIENAAARRSTESGLQGNEETGQPTEIIPPQPIALVIDSPVPVATNPENMENEFYDFINGWNEHSLKDKEQFIVHMVKGFPTVFTPSMVMDLLQTMLDEEVKTDVWMRMLRFIMMLERHIFDWDQRKVHRVGEMEYEIDKPIPHGTHQRFQEFLIKHARKILTKYGDRQIRVSEAPEAGFMRFIAFLFGFVCKDQMILKLMDRTWTKFGFKQQDASRAMVWGYKNWKDTRVPGRTTDTESDNSKPNFEHFNHLMNGLKYQSTRRPYYWPGPNPCPWLDEPDEFDVGSRAQHYLFALGCGYEPDWKEGPLAYMCDEEADVTTPYTGKDYLWLMNGRDLMAGNAWEWMCKEGMSEHDRMVRRFYRDDASDDRRLYEHIVEMVTKYEQDYYAKGGKCLLTYAMRKRMDRDINFGEHDDWYHDFQQNKRSVGVGINDWLIKNKNSQHRPPLQYNVEDE